MSFDPYTSDDANLEAAATALKLLFFELGSPAAVFATEAAALQAMDLLRLDGAELVRRIDLVTKTPALMARLRILEFHGPLGVALIAGVLATQG